MKSINLAHETFILEMLAHGIPQQAYLAAYPNATPSTLRSAPYRLLARPDIGTRLLLAIQENQEKIQTPGNTRV